MTDVHANGQGMIGSKYHAIEDIIYRWFAFFEGETEAVSEHSDIFTEDVQLVHAGTHLLANDRPSVERWLMSIPPSRSSHFVEGISVSPIDENLVRASWSVRYQYTQDDGVVGGSIISYQAVVSFFEAYQAQFLFLQKTPIRQNPDAHYKDSFSENRLLSFLARLKSVLLEGDRGGLSDLLGNYAEGQRLQAWLEQLTPSQFQDLGGEVLDDQTLQLSLNNTVVCQVRLQVEGGRYASVSHVNFAHD